MAKPTTTTEAGKEALGLTADHQPTDLMVVKEADDAMLAEFAGQGNENVAAVDTAIPLLVVLQSMSPQTKRTEAAYVPGATEGLLFNTLTQEIYGETVEVIDCHFLPVEAEWTPRTKGGGFRGVYPVNDPIVATATEDPERRGSFTLPNGNNLVHTAQHYVLVKGARGWSPAVMPLKGTHLKRSRRLNALLTAVVLTDAYGNALTSKPGQVLYAPRFAHVVKVSLIPERNDQGSWFSPTFELVRRVTAAELGLAKAFRDTIARGEVEVNLGQDVSDAATPAAGAARGPVVEGDAQSTRDLEDEIPF